MKRIDRNTKRTVIAWISVTKEGIGHRRSQTRPFNVMQMIRRRAITPRKRNAHLMHPSTSRKVMSRRENVTGGNRWATVRAEPCRVNDRGQVGNEAATS